MTLRARGRPTDDGRRHQFAHRVFEDYYPRYLPMIKSLVFGLAGRSADVDALAQETFTRFYAALLAGKKIGSPVAYVKTTAANLAIDYLRLASTNAEQLVDAFPAPVEWAAVSSVTGQDIAGDLLDLVSAMNTVLSAELRICLILTEWAGFTRSQVAEIMGIKPDSVTKNVKRAVTKLREYEMRDGQRRRATSLEGGNT